MRSARESSQRLVDRAVVMAAAITVAGMFAAVAVHQPVDIVSVRQKGTVVDVPLQQFLATNFNPRGAKSDITIDVATLAALASNVYEDPDVYQDGCDARQPGRIRVPGWEQLKGWSYPDACNAALSGLHYEVWSAMDREGIGYQIVVFRGTIPTRLAHWCSNLRGTRPPICDTKSDQYLSIMPLIDDTLSGIYDEWGPDRYTLLVGHSLGGGLAELAARSSYIDQVVGFNPSPVTGTDLSEEAARVFDSAGATDKFLREYLSRSGCHLRLRCGASGAAACARARRASWAIPRPLCAAGKYDSAGVIPLRTCPTGGARPLGALLRAE